MRLLLVSVILLYNFQTFGQTVEELRTKAIEHVYRKQYAEAEVLFSRILEIDPHDDICYLDRGLVRESQHNIYGAIEDFTQQIGIDSTAPDGWFLRGILLQKIGDTLHAMNDFRQVVELDYYNSDAHLFLGQDFDFLQDIYSADTCFKNALLANPENEGVFDSWIQLTLENGNLSKFDSLVSLQFSLYPDQLTSNYWAVLRNQLLKSVPFSDVREGVLSVGTEISYQQLVNRELASKKITAPWVEIILKPVLSENKIDSIHLQAFIKSGLTFRVDKSVKKGLKQLKRIKSQKPEYHRLSAIYFAQRGKWKEVVAHQNSVVSMYRILPEDLLLLSEALLKMGDIKKSCETYSRYLQMTEQPVLYPFYRVCHQ